ncbi:MAG: hypothetical protein V3V14_08960 [Saprospiraceae bacterium]
MKYIINLVLLFLIGLLAFMLYSSIKEPVAFGNAKKYRKDIVVNKLQEIRTSQELYKSIKGEFAPSWEALIHTLKTDSIPLVKILEDENDSQKFEKFITYSSAFDSIKSLGLNLDSLSLIPFGKGKSFEIAADTIEYQKTIVSVVEVGTKWKNFMGKYADIKYSKYDNKYDPNSTIKFGNMNKPNLSGNWE